MERDYMVRVTRHPRNAQETITTDFVKVRAGGDAEAAAQALTNTSLHVAGHEVECHEAMGGPEFRPLS